MSVKNQVVAIGAIGTQTKIAEKIKAGKDDYVLSVKGSQPSLNENITAYLMTKSL